MTNRNIAIDKTNRLDFELFVILLEYEHEAYPLAYLYLQQHGEDGARKSAIEKFLRAIRERNVNPVTFSTDKDEGQIAAIRRVFPQCTVLLCYWHILQAAERKMGSVTFSEREFRRYSIHPPNFPFLSSDFPSLPRVSNPFRVPISKNMKKKAKKMIRLHFNRHPLFPNDQTHSFLNKAEIYYQCVEDMYKFCKENEWDSLWVYFWLHWYEASSWSLWALSATDDCVPLSRTTTFVESHWRSLKRDHLLKYNRAVRVFNSVSFIQSIFSD